MRPRSPAEVWRQVVALAVAKAGSLLIAADTGGTIWRSRVRRAAFTLLEVSNPRLKASRLLVQGSICGRYNTLQGRPR
jgi:hypothetical protein